MIWLVRGIFFFFFSLVESSKVWIVGVKVILMVLIRRDVELFYFIFWGGGGLFKFGIFDGT